MTISRSRGTIGCRRMPDGLDSGYCTMNHRSEKAVVRLNLDGIWTLLCQECLDKLLLEIMCPDDAPQAPKVRSTVSHHPWGDPELDAGNDYR